MIPQELQKQINQKLPRLKEIYDCYGDFWLNSMFGGKPIWEKWKEYTTCTPQELKEANLRQIQRPEVVLDPDNIDPLDVRDKLIKEKFSFYTFCHGYPLIFGRNHFHLWYPELTELEPRARVLAKKSIISHFECDLLKAGEKTLIYMPFAPHGKTGRIKVLLERFEDGKQLA